MIYVLCCRGEYPGLVEAAGKKDVTACPLSRWPIFCSPVVQAKGFTRSLTYREEEYTIKKRLKFRIYTKAEEGRKAEQKRIVGEDRGWFWRRDPDLHLLHHPGKEGERKNKF